MESRIVELRRRTRFQARRATRVALVAVGVGAAIGVVGLGAYLAWRWTRPASKRERLLRVVPPGLRDGAGGVRRRLSEGVSRQVPPMRLYVGDRQV
ncbi:MAG: hypothetical protein M3024_07780, partial [Candidatus Dormibacteraeota bacterium]|nr:hypothetical protein [Candidatus Dormibacteraeota bacterium]